ncbi:MAG TPA: hypothetical protein VGC97_06385 [Pyrinomonadaceae bacterium]
MKSHLTAPPDALGARFFLPGQYLYNRDVLVFATANDVRDLESEQFRIGRFSYIHFVDLPNAGDRQEIFKVHLQKRALSHDRLKRNADTAAGMKEETRL